MSLCASGIIYFIRALDGGALCDTAFFIAQAAAECRIGILLGANVPGYVADKFRDLYGISSVIDGGSLMFCMSDSAYYAGCDTLLSSAVIDSDKCTADIGGTSLSRVQDFFEAIAARNEISHIRLDIETAFDRPENFAVYECAPRELCDTVAREMGRSGRFEPSVRVIMTK